MYRAFAVRARGHSTFYADNVHYVDRHVWFVLTLRPQYTLQRESQQRSNAVGFEKKFILYAHLISHLIVVCAERNRVFILVIIVIDVIVITYYINGFKRVAARTFFLKSRVQKFIYISHFIWILENCNFRVVFGEICCSIRSHSVSCDKSQTSPDQARNLRHSNLWRESSSSRGCSSRSA